VNPPRRPRRAAVLAAALHSWTVTTRGEPTDPHTARLVIRQAPDWDHVGSDDLTEQQIDRLLQLLREDLIHPGPATAVQAAATVDQILAEWRAEGRRAIRPGDWLPLLPRIGRSRQWLAGHLVHLADAKYLRETRKAGTYRI